MIVFDVSRLVGRAHRVTPTGIDRVELAYARHFIAAGAPLCFARATRFGGISFLPRRAVERYVEALAVLWHEGANWPRRARVCWTALRLALPSWGPRPAIGTRRKPAAATPVYLLVSHHHLEKCSLLARLKRRHNAAFVCVIHDLIPIQFPEYVRPGQDKRHRRRIETAAKLADAVIVPSQSTGDAIRPFIANAHGGPRVMVSPFGIERPSTDRGKRPALSQAYFVCLGTVEARKNHLLLLNLWRDISARNVERRPVLVLIGRRGWEIENTIDMLGRCPALRGLVSEQGRVSDAEVTRLLRGARALLLPSYAEGFGFPLIEALACGTPVLCSDLPALREIGKGIPEYFDPLDGNGWRAAIFDYASDPSPRRDAQLQRLAQWQLPSWEAHFAMVEQLIAEFATSPRQL